MRIFNKYTPYSSDDDLTIWHMNHAKGEGGRIDFSVTNDWALQFLDFFFFLVEESPVVWWCMAGSSCLC